MLGLTFQVAAVFAGLGRQVAGRGKAPTARAREDELERCVEAGRKATDLKSDVGLEKSKRSRRPGIYSPMKERS
jgi:hypothetical protein